MDGPAMPHFEDAREAWEFLKNHDIFCDAMGTNRFWPDCFRFEPDFSPPGRVFVECGRWFLPHELAAYEQAEHPFGQYAPDENFSFEAPDLKTAVVELASRVYREYGDGKPEIAKPVKAKN